MPRNPNKAHCQVRGCHFGATRGHSHYHSHRGAKLGPCAAVASTANLNALETSHHAQLLDGIASPRCWSHPSRRDLTSIQCRFPQKN